MDLAQLEEQARASKPPALADTADTLVFGEGNPDANLIIVGEAPGEEEDKSGRPFVGRAGQLLDRILESVGLDRDDIYITNIVKYRPPGNRNPKPEEIAASEPVLVEQIKIIRPQVIATLGNISTQYFTGTKEGITKTHGTWYEWHGIKIYPLYHPAYLLRNPSRKQGSPKWQMWEDMKALKEELDTLGDKPSKLVIDTAQQESLF
ncbi:MAG: uracil-DNA glycosylase [Trueperaceae bacterium]|nr:uracil-DNA glycosylase [Trueperaceae bacterium]